MKLNLDPQYIDDYWKLKSVDLAQFLQQVSNLEKWTLTDNLIFQDKLNELIKVTMNWEVHHYARNSKKIFKIMSYMNIAQFAYFFSYLDNKFEGLLIHLMLDSQLDSDCEASQLFFKRLQIINESNFLVNMLHPLRTKVVQGYLENK